MAVYISTLEELNRTILSDSFVLIYFSADWCGPCKRIGPFIETLTRKYSLTLYKINVDNVEQAIIDKYDIRSLPTIALFRHNRIYGKVIGADEEKIEDFITGKMNV